MSLGKKFIKNSISNVAGWVWLILLSIATVPYIVHKLGYDAYGILSLVLMVLGYFAFLDFGLGEAVIKYFSHYHAKQEYEKMNRILNSILVLFILIGLIGAGGIIVFAHFFAMQVFKVPVVLQPDARFCFLLSSVGFIFNLIFGVVSKIPEAVQRFDVSNRNNVITGTLVSIGNVVLLALGFGLKEVVILNFIGTLLGIGLFYHVSKKLVPELRINFRFAIEDIKEVFSFGVLTLMTKFSTVIIQTASQLTIGILTGPAGVTIFNVPFKIISRFGGFVNRLSYSIFPMSSELNAKDNKEKLQEVYLRLSRYVFLISSIFFFPLAGFSREILTCWMGADFAAKGHVVMFFCCLSYYLFTLTTVSGLVAMGLGNPRINTVFSFLTAAINVATIYPFTKFWGVNGAALSLFLSSLQVPVALAFNNEVVIGIRSGCFFKVVFGRIAAVYLICLAIIKLMAPYTDGNVGLMLLGVLISYVVLIMITWHWALTPVDREKIAAKYSELRKRMFGSST